MNHALNESLTRLKVILERDVLADLDTNFDAIKNVKAAFEKIMYDAKRGAGIANKAYNMKDQDWADEEFDTAKHVITTNVLKALGKQLRIVTTQLKRIKTS